jgi:hypothetical protein
MKTKLIFFAVAALLVSSVWSLSSSAAGRDRQFGPFLVATTDGGSCGNSWANDVFDRFWNVHNNGDGTFSVREEDKDGSFATIGGASPGACTDTNHGSSVNAGITGTMVGYVEYTVAGGSYDPAGCSAVGANCSTRSGFFSATFPGAVWDFGRWGFEYTSGNKTLLYHHWADVSDVTGTDEIFRGDIANQ